MIRPKKYLSLGNLQLVKVEAYNLSEADPEISEKGWLGHLPAIWILFILWKNYFKMIQNFTEKDQRRP